MDKLQAMIVINILILLLYNLEGVAGQCTGTDTIGKDKTDSRKKKNYDGDPVNAVLETDKDYKFTCCGFISQWEIYARDGPLVDVHVQVWYDTGTLWNLRGENVITPTTKKAENIITIAAGNRIRAEANDQIGFYEPLGSVITYDKGGGGSATYKTTTFGSGVTSYDWDSVSQDKDSEHALHAIIIPSQSPTFTNNLPDTLTIQNTEGVGTNIYQLTTSDGDTEDTGQLTVSLTSASGIASTLFEFDTITLEISVKAALVPGTYTLTFSVTDPCLLETTGELTIIVDNDPPVIDSLAISNSIDISEDNTAEQLLHTLQVTDSDAFTCSLDTTSVPFEIKLISGSTNYGLYLSSGATMDYDTQNAYVLTLSCTDSHGAKTTGTYTVNLIRNEPPTISGLPSAVDIQEDTITETTLYTMVVTDPTNDVVTCTVTSIVPATSIFFLKSSITFNEFDIILQSNPNLQYDLIRTYKLNILCSDGRTSVSNVFYVNVLRNRPPSFINLQNVTSISSIGSAIGQIVFQVEVTDPESDQLTYSMSCNPSVNCPFDLYNSGEIVITRSVEGEFTAVYDLYVYVSDGKSSIGPRSLTVHILDINYIPVIRNLPLPSPLVVSENEVPGLEVFHVYTQDNDDSDDHTYTMTSDPGDGMQYFKINGSNGLITTSTVTNINYEVVTSSTYIFTITVSDTKDLTSQNMSITIADVNEPPVFTKTTYVLTTDEAAAGTILADPGYLYTDEDTSDTHKYSMNCGLNVGLFSIASTTGRISLATAIDVDVAGVLTSYTCTVTISDGILTDTATLVININDINDNTPVFSNSLFTYHLDINTAVNTVFGSTVATDADNGTYGTFTYSLDQIGIGGDTFGIQGNGDLYLKNSLTIYDYGQSLSFTVQAIDSGGLQGTTDVYVIILQTTTLSTTTTERYVTFWEYPANTAWVVIAITLAIIICILPCVMIWRNGCSCTDNGRPDKDNRTIDINAAEHNRPQWKPWRWYQVNHR